MEFIDEYNEEINGQLNFLGIEEQLNSSFLELINFSKIAIKKLILLKEEMINDDSKGLFYYQNIYENLFKDYFNMYDYFDLEDLIIRYENYSSLYHNLGKWFIFYLGNFIYKGSYVNCLNVELYIKMENFIKMDPIKYNDKFSKSILEIIDKRNKLRVENYVIYYAKPFLEKMEVILDSLKLDEELFDIVKKLLDDKILRDKIFEQIRYPKEDEKNIILGTLFLKYLEKRVYVESYNNYIAKIKKFNSQIEDYVVFNMVDINKFSSKQKEILEIAKCQVSKRLSTFILEQKDKINLMLNDFDRIEDFRKNGQIRIIESEDDISSLPVPYSEDEVRLKLETFLRSIFRSTSYVDDLLIFRDELKNLRNEVLEIALEYLYRFVYKVSEYYKMDDTFIMTLENSIIKCNDFSLKNSSSELCYAKSILLSRVARRNILSSSLVRNRRK